MNSSKRKKKNDQSYYVFYGLFIVSGALADIVTYSPQQTPGDDFFSHVLGISVSFAFGSFSQRIISNNLFTRYTLIGLVIVLIGFLKQWFTHFDLFALYVVVLPLAYILYFRLLTQLFYPNYPHTSPIPRIIYHSPYGKGIFESSNKGIPLRDRVFSVLLLLGFMFVGLLLVLLLHSILTPYLVQAFPTLA